MAKKIPDQDAAVLAPYAGALSTRLQRFLRKSIVPMTVVFCLLYGAAFGIYGQYLPRIFGVPLGIMACLIVWALPDMKRAPTRTMTVLFYAFPLALILWPNYLAFALPGLPWITLQRLLGGPMTLLFLICISISPAFRARLLEINSAAPWVWKLLVAFSGIMVVTLGFSSDPFFSLQKMITAQMNWVVMFFIATFAFMKKGRPTLWAALMCLTFIPMYLIVFKEHADSQVPWANHIPSFLKIEDESVLRTLAGGRRDGGEYRVEGTFSTALGLSEYCALVIPFMLYFMTGGAKWWIKIACAVSIPMLFQVILQTDARLGLMGSIVSIGLFGALQAWHMWRTKKDTLIGPAIVIGYPVLAAAFFVATLVVGRLRARIWGTGQGQYDASNQARIDMYKAGTPIVMKHPWGHGAGTGAGVLNFVTPGGVLTIDTYYLAIALEYGVLGFLIYYGMLIMSVYYGGHKVMFGNIDKDDPEQRLLIPISVTVTGFIFIKSVFSVEDNHPLIFAMIGMAVALLARARATGSQAAPLIRAV